MSNDLTTDYGFSAPAVVESSRDLIAVEQSRAQHEVQAAFVIAQRFPRDESAAFSRIMKSCDRPFLAEQAMYAYPKGGKVINGPSIRLAEVLLQNWQNCEAGIKELSQSNGVSVAEAFAIDYQTNTRISKTFHVPHSIGTKNGPKKLTDPRDIYELVANQGARRMRACILSIIPGDIAEAAVERSKQTLVKGKEPIADRIRKLVMAFDEVGVKVEHIEKRLGHKLDATIPEEIVTLGSIFKSIRDGMAGREDFFDFGKNQPSAVATERLDSLINPPKKALEPEVVDTKTGEILPVSNSPDFSYENVKKGIQSAKTVDDLNTAADLIGVIQDVAIQDELKALYKKRLDALKK